MSTSPAESTAPKATPAGPAAEGNKADEPAADGTKKPAVAPKELIWALKKEQGFGLGDESFVREADTGFEVMALLHKNKTAQQRYNIKHFRDGELVSESDKAAEEEEGEKHLTPQHRRFLTHPKVGPGAPQKREKLSNSMRLDRAAAGAHKYQMIKLGFVDQDAGVNDLTKHKGIDSTIEDKIQLAILQGDFDNLKGQGRPIEKFQNPLIDRTTDMAYEILRKNGIKPEWIELQQTMNSLKDDLRARLRADWAHHCLDKHAERTANAIDEDAAAFHMPRDATLFTQTASVKYEVDERAVNSKVDAYNLNVPSHVLTRGRIILAYEIDKVVKEEQWGSAEDAAAALQQARRAAAQLEHVRHSVMSEMLSRSQGKEARATKGPGFMYSRTAHDHATQPGRAYRPLGHGAPLLASRGGVSGGGGGDLVFRALMIPVDMMANALIRVVQRLTF